MDTSLDRITWSEAVELISTPDDELFLKAFVEGYEDLQSHISSTDSPEYRRFFSSFCHRETYPAGFAKELGKIQTNTNNHYLFNHFFSVSSDDEFETLLELIH